jgi:NADPH-dependent 2,4-dienoyl-CoA reductase/sulfur reductase-like enzyme
MSRMSEAGVNLRFNERVLGIEGAQGGQVVVTDKGRYRFDAVIVAVGVEPNVELAKELGLRIGETGAIWVDDHMRTSMDNVYAAGDSVETINLVTGKPYYHPFGPTANKMGYVAGTNVAGGDARFPGVVGTSFTKFMDLQVGSTGLTARDAAKFGFKPVSALIKARTRARYYPGGREIWVKLVADAGSMRLIGAQVLGYEEVLGRVNVLSLAIAKGVTVEELFFTDLAYLPAVTTVWDPLITAARQLMK